MSLKCIDCTTGPIYPCDKCMKAKGSESAELRCSIARFGEIKNELGDCDFMRTFLNTWTVDAVLWMMAEIERLHKTEQ